MREWVFAPINLVNLRMMIGRAQPKSADTAGGSTPDTKVNDPGDASDQDCKKGT